jgi:hypothetical protein
MGVQTKMKGGKMKTTLITLTVCCTIFAFVVPIQAATIWSPTESGQIDVNFIGELDVAIFDDEDVGYANPLELAEIADTITFNMVGNDWVLESTQTGNSLTLADSSYFVIALALGNWIGSTEFEKLAFGIYNVNWGPDAQIKVIDAQPVPLPASVLLLGAGLLGLMGIRHRK